MWDNAGPTSRPVPRRGESGTLLFAAGRILQPSSPSKSLLPNGKDPTLEPPSRQLQQVLLSKNLCTARDLRRCSSRVRRLTFDLPGFDSVWLDALVQRRVLTSFQARTIESGDHDRLTIGPSVVLDQIGRGPGSETFLTRLPGEHSTCIVKRVVVPSELRIAAMKRMQRLIERGRNCQHPGVVIPHACREIPGEVNRSGSRRPGPGAGLATESRLAIVSRPSEGLTLAQMLLRRGRLPERTVMDIARQLLDVCGALQDGRIVHGEIRLGNLLLSARGQVALVDCGIRPAIRPAFEVSAFVEPESNDGIAPELIGTGDAASPASDLYAVGCALWQLLTGRPPHPTGDSLAKLAAHQTERIPDVRDLAPETPARLAEAILWLTEPDPRNRPAHPRDLLVGGAPQPGPSRAPSRPVLGQPGRRSRSALASFAGQFHHPVARLRDRRHRPRMARRLVQATAAMFLAVGALHVFSGRETVPLSIDAFNGWVQSQYTALTAGTGFAAGVEDGSATESAPNSTATGGGGQNLRDAQTSPIPEPAADGTIEFPHTGPWQATSIVWAGPRLTLKGPPGPPARIIVADAALELRSAEVRLENVELLLVEPSTSTPPIICQSQTLQMQGCAILSPLDMLDHGSASGVAATGADGPVTSVAESTANVGLRWLPIDASDPLAGRVTIRDCRFIGSHSSIEFNSAVRVVRCVNTLKLGGGPLLITGRDAEPTSRTIELEQVTVRESSALMSVWLPADEPWQSRITVRSTDCVFAGRQDSPDAASLIAFVDGTLSGDWHRSVVIDGRGSVAGSGINLVSLQSADGRQRRVLDDSQLQVRGLTSTPVTFQGQPSFDPVDSVVARIEANRRSSDPPGISIDD